MEYNHIDFATIVDTVDVVWGQPYIVFSRYSRYSQIGERRYNRRYVATRERIRRLIAVLGEPQLDGVRIRDDGSVSSRQCWWSRE